MSAKLWSFMGKLVLNAAGKLAFSSEPCCCEETGCCPNPPLNIHAHIDAVGPWSIPIDIDMGPSAFAGFDWSNAIGGTTVDGYCDQPPATMHIALGCKDSHNFPPVVPTTWTAEITLDDTDNGPVFDHIVSVNCNPFRVVAQFHTGPAFDPPSLCTEGETWDVVFTALP